MKKNNDATEFIETAAGEQKEILTTLRKMIEKTVPNCEEQFKWSRPVYKIEKDFCYLRKNKNNIALGFFNSSKLDDKNKLLTGTGADMRHIKINSMSDINNDAFIDLLEQASKI